MGFEFWLSRWKKVTAASQPIRSRGQIRKVRSRSGLGVEELESRVVPTAISWTGSAGTMNWGTAANWSTNSVPTAGDNVTISLSGIGTIDVGPGNYSVLTLDDSTAALLVETGGSLSFASASPLSILSQNITVQSGATLAFGANSSVEIGPSSTLTVDGNLNFANADTVSFTFSSGATTEISVASGGTMTATNTAFSNATPTSDTAEIIVATGGQLQSSASTYSLTEVSLNEQLATGNLTSNSFNCPLYIQAFDVPFLSGTGNNNFQFDDIYIDGTTIASGTLSLNPIGTGSTANLVWLIGGNTTIAAGATLSIGSGVDFSIADGSELDDYGTFSFGGGNTLTFGDTFDGTNQLVVESGGSLIANNTLFAAASTFANTTELTVDAGGLIHVSNSTFSITQVTLNNELTTGNLTGDIFDGPLSVLAQDVQYLSGTGNQNVQFQDVEIQAYDLPSGTYALTAIGTGSTANLIWIFAGNFAVEAGAALSIAPGLNVTIDANCEIDDYGSLAFGANDAVAFGYTGFATTQIVVEDDGTMTADDDRFTADSTDATFNTAQIVVDNGGQIQFANSIFTLTQVALNGSLSTGNLVGNTFNCPLSLPEWDVPYLSGTGNQNFEFQDIEILTGDLASGTLALDAIGTGSTANLLWILDGNFKIDGGATLAVGTDVNFAILGGMELDDYGTLTFAGGDVATFDDAFDATEQIAVEYGATLTANSTQFIQANSFANTAEISVANGGQIEGTDCAFTLTEVNLDETLSAGDLTGNTFTCSLELPVPDLPFISGSANVSFDDVELLPYALTSGSTLTLNLIGSGSKANLVYVFAGDFTIDGGATLAIAPNVSLAIVGGYTVDDYGTMTLSSGDSTAFEYDIFATTELIVENGGSLTASTAQFVDSPTNDTNSELLVENDGQIQASNSTFALGEVYLNCALSVGSLTGNTFDCPLYLPGTDVQYLSGAGSSNLQFEAIEILPGTVEAGQTLAFDSIGSGSTANLVYILTGNTAIDFGAALAIGADVNVELDPNVTLADSGDLTFGGGDTLSFASGPGDTTQIDVANGGVAIAAGVDFANSTPTWNNEFITVASGGQLQASNDSFNVTSLTLASGSSGTVLYDTFSSQLEVDSNSTFAIQYDDFTDVPSNPANDGIIATGNPNATINLTDNYWGTTVASQIAAKILDHTLDPTTRPTIAFSPALGQKVSQTFGSSASTAYSTSAQTLSLSASITSPSGIIDEGTATFTLLSGSTTIGSPVTVNVSNGSAVAPYVIPAGSAVGTYTIQVSYNGTANYSASSDSTQTLTIAAAATSTAATNAGATYSSGSQSVGLRATVASSAGIVDAGTVIFEILSGSTIVGSPVFGNVINGLATANFILPAGTPTGSYTIDAAYGDAANFGTSTDSSHTLIVDAAPSVTGNPSDATVDAGGNVTFAASASGYPTPSVQWQVSFNGGGTFGNVSNSSLYSGATTDTLTIASATAGLDGYLYRAQFENTLSGASSPSTATTTAAMLTVDSAPSVTSNPTSEAIQSGGNTSFSAAASGNPTPSVQWMVSTDGGNTYTILYDGGNYSGSSTDTLYVSGATSAMNGYLYEATYSNTLYEAGVPSTATTAPATLNVDSAPAVTVNPSNAAVVAGSNTSFTAAATGYPTPTVQWQASINGGSTYFNLTNGGVYSGVYTDVLKITGATSVLSGNLYRAAFTNTISGSPNSSDSTSATLTVDTLPSVTGNPSSATIVAGGNASFTSTASGSPAPSVQWQVSTNGGQSYSNVANGGVYSGATSNSLLITGATTAMAGWVYEAVFSSNLPGYGSPVTATSLAATLNVDFAPSVTANPTNSTVLPGSNATFTVAASGYPTPTVQWQLSTNGGATYANISNGGVYSGATAYSLQIEDATAALSGNLYRAVLSNTLYGNSSASTATSSAATLFVESAPTVTANPTNANANAEASATFTAAASGYPTPSVQWLVSTDGGNTFNDVPNDGDYSGANTDELSIAAAAASMNGYLYEAVFSNQLVGSGSPSTAATTAAMLTVDFAPVVSSEPTSQTIDSGTNLSLAASATGNPAPAVQWQVSTDNGNTFANLGNGGAYSGVTTSSLQIANAPPSFDGDEYRAVFSNTLFGATSPSTATTSAATLRVDTAPIVSGNPSSSTIAAGGAANFTAAAIGNPTPSVQWLVSTNGGATYADVENGGPYSGATTNTLNVAGAIAGMNGYLFEAEFSNQLAGAGAPSTITSSAATLTVDSAPSISTNPTSQAIDASGSATFTAAASGFPVPTVQWQVSINGGTSFTNLNNSGGYNGATSTTLTIGNATAAMDGYEYRATFSNTLVGATMPSTATTSAATLSVDTAPTISGNPTAATVNSGSSANFTASASGEPAPSVQWQVSTDGGNTFANVQNGTIYSGTTGDTLTIASANPGMNGYFYRAIFSNTLAGSGQPDSVATTAAALAVDSAPSIAANPSNLTLNAGSSASFTASAIGNPAPAVQWQVSTDGGNTFANVENGGVYSGATTDALLIASVPASANGDVFRAVFSNQIVGSSSPSSATTSAATLAVDSAPVITVNPENASTVVGGSATFSAAASGNPVPAVQWLVSTDGGKTFTALSDGGSYSGVNTRTLSVENATLTMSGYEYEGAFSNTLQGGGSPSSDTTSAATLTVALAGDPATASVTVSSSTLTAGSSIVVTLQAKDSSGNDITTGGLTVGFALAHSGGARGTFSAVTDNGNGTYTATFTGTIAGTNAIAATIQGVAVSTAQPSIAVTPGAFSPSHSFASLSLPSVQLGGESTIALQAEDAFGNDETAGGLSVAFELENAGGGRGTIGSVTDNGNGTYTAPFIGTVDGNNAIEALVSGAAISSTPPSIAVAGASFGLAKSVVSVAAPSIASGGSTTVTLVAEDAKGNKETSGGLTVSFKLASASGGRGTFGPVVDRDNGTYTATFVGTLAGANSILATIDGQTVSSKAPAIKVVTGAVSLATSVLTLSSSTAAAGSKVTVTLQPYDAAGNKLQASGLAVHFSLSGGSSSQGTFSAVKYNANGTYTATFVGQVAGGYAIAATIGGQPIASAAPVITVTPGLASALRSTLAATSTSVAVGSAITVTLQAVDAYGNDETSGGSLVSFLLRSTTGGKGTFGKVIDEKNGTYKVTFTGTLAGTNYLEATIGGIKMTSAILPITVIA